MKATMKQRLFWVRHSVGRWYATGWRAAIQARICRGLHPRAYRCLPPSLRNARLVDAIGRLAFDASEGAKAEARHDSLAARLIQTEQEVADLRLQLSIAGTPGGKRILETFGLTEEWIQ